MLRTVGQVEQTFGRARSCCAFLNRPLRRRAQRERGLVPDPHPSALGLQHHPQVALVGAGAKRSVRGHPPVAKQGQREAAGKSLNRPRDLGTAEEVDVF